MHQDVRLENGSVSKSRENLQPEGEGLKADAVSLGETSQVAIVLQVVLSALDVVVKDRERNQELGCELIRFDFLWVRCKLRLGVSPPDKLSVEEDGVCCSSSAMEKEMTKLMSDGEALTVGMVVGVHADDTAAVFDVERAGYVLSLRRFIANVEVV